MVYYDVSSKVEGLFQSLWLIRQHHFLLALPILLALLAGEEMERAKVSGTPELHRTVLPEEVTGGHELIDYCSHSRCQFHQTRPLLSVRKSE